MSDALLAAIQVARAARPGVEVPEEIFRRFVEDRVPEGASLAEGLTSLDVTDLYLACACALGLPAAIAAFERDVLPGVAPAVSRIDRDPAFADEVRHELRVHLLVAESGESPRIAHYLGRGPLRSFVQVAAIRLGYTLKRRVAREAAATPGDSDDIAELWCDDSPELARARMEIGAPFRAAFVEAFRGLERRERNVLRLYLVDGVSSEAIGQMYAVHRATVARWIAGAEEALLAATRKHLARSLDLRDAEVDSILRLARSQLNVSLSTLLRTHDGSPRQ